MTWGSVSDAGRLTREAYNKGTGPGQRTGVLGIIRPNGPLRVRTGNLTCDRQMVIAQCDALIISPQAIWQEGPAPGL